jgi:hypothetical protein
MRIIITSGMLEDYTFEDVCDVFTSISCIFEVLVDLFPLYNKDRVFYIIKELDKRSPEDSVCPVFKPVYFNTVFLDI